jgi:hypothetical protein
MNKPADFIAFNSNLFERMRDMHRSWLEKLRERSKQNLEPGF